MAKQKILITGANGFLGSNLTKYLSENSDYEVYAMVRPKGTVNFLYEFQKNTRTGENLFELVEADLSDDESVQNALKGMDMVIHLAGMVTDWGEWDQFYELNVEGTARVLRGASAAGVSRVIFLSSLTVHAMKGHIDGDEKTARDMKHFPYGETKKLAEDLVTRWGEEEGHQSAVVRPGFVIYGPYDKNTFINVLHAIKSGTFAYIDGGRRLISYVYVENLCYGIDQLLKSPVLEGAYNILDGNMSWKEWTERWSGVLSVKSPRVTVPYWLMYPFVWLTEKAFKLFRIKKAPLLSLYRIGIMHRDLSFRNSRMKDEIGYDAPYSFEKAAECTVKFYRKSKNR